MNRERFSAEHIVAMLKQAEAGVPIVEVIHKAGISEQIVHHWKEQSAEVEVDQVRQLKQLQEENARLKRLVADLTSRSAML